MRRGRNAAALPVVAVPVRHLEARREVEGMDTLPQGDGMARRLTAHGTAHRLTVRGAGAAGMEAGMAPASGSI
jgi:hypothetical protein